MRHVHIVSLLRTLALCACVCTCSIQPLRAQTPQKLQVLVTVVPPYSPYIEQWRTHPERIQCTVRNMTNEVQRFHLAGWLRTEDGSFRMATKPDGVHAEFDIQPMAQLLLDGTSYPLFDPNMVDVTGGDEMRTRVTETGRLPEGRYTMCVVAMDAATKQQISWGEPAGCIPFEILYADAPRPIMPRCGEEVLPGSPQVLMFTWTPSVVNVPPEELQFLVYELQIVPVADHESPEEAMRRQGEPDWFRRTTGIAPLYLCTPADPEFMPGGTYAWRVRVRHPADRVPFRDDGFSPVCSFRLPQASMYCFALSVVEPLDEAITGWSSTPTFKVHASKRLDSARVRGGLFQVWRMMNQNENTATAMARAPVLRRDFTGRSQTFLAVKDADDGGSDITLTCAYLADSAKFAALDGGWYVWSFLLRHETGILVGGPACVRTETAMPSSTFGYKTCLALATHYPVGRVNIAKDDKPQFMLRANPKMDPDAVYITSLQIFEVDGPDKVITPDMIPVAAFNNGGRAKLTGLFSGLSSHGTSTADSLVNVLVVNHPETYDPLLADSTVAKQVWQPEHYRWYAWRVSITFVPLKDVLWEGNRCTQVGVTSTTGYVYFERKEPVPPDKCIVLRAHEPYATVSNTLRPQFVVRVSPTISQAAITGGQLKIWAMTSVREEYDEVRKRAPHYDKSFEGNSPKLLRVLPDADEETPLDLVFVNTKPETGDDIYDPKLVNQTAYLWEFTLTYTKEQIRRDKVVCTVASSTSTPNWFYLSKTVDDCPDDCTLPPPTAQTPVMKEFKRGDVLSIGRFEMHVVDATGTGAGLRGTGTITLGFVKQIVAAVEFFDVKVNSAHRIYQGTVSAQIAENTTLTPDLANGLGESMGMSSEALISVQSAASEAARLAAALLGQPAKVPIGFSVDILGHKTTAGIMGLVFTPTAAYMNVAASVLVPSLGPGVGFGIGARKICVTPTSMSSGPSVQFYLPTDVGYLPDDATWGMKFLAPSAADSGCYMTWDCKGFRDLHLSLQVEFPRGWVRPFPTDDGLRRVKAVFRTVVARDWNWIASASMDRCELTDYPGMVLEVQTLAFDHSAIENPVGMKFPRGFTGDTTAAWTGFYIGRGAVSIPDLHTFGDDRPFQIAIQNMLIGRGGFCASFRAENVFHYPTGNFGGWGGSLDTLAIDFLNSSLQAGTLKGRIHMPLIMRPLAFSASIARSLPTDAVQGIRYNFTVRPDSIADINAWKARVELERTSCITLTNDNPTRTFNAMALLNMRVGIEGSFGAVPEVNMPKLRFTNMRLQMAKPKFVLGGFGLASPQKGIAGFPISISNIGFVEQTSAAGDLSGLSFDLNVNFTVGLNPISGTTTLVLWGRMANPATDPSFEYHDIDFKGVRVFADAGLYKVDGSFTLYDRDPVYGRGWEAAAAFEMVKLFKLQASVKYGSKDDITYFGFDASIAGSNPVPCGPVGLYGFRGGVWVNMERTDSLTSQVTLGSAPPGIDVFRLIPKKNVMGMRAGVVLGTLPRPTSFNMDLLVEAVLTADEQDGSLFLSRFTLRGEGYNMCEISQRKNAKVREVIDISYYGETGVWHGIFTAAITAPPLTGGGQGVFHHGSPWYFKLGEPTKGFTASIASWLPKVEAYLMLGDSLPPPAPLPEIITRVVGAPSAVRPAAVMNGTGIVFGSSIAWSTGRRTFGPFYASFDLYGGFDLTLMQQKKCPGINGWQAQGKLYGYVSGTVGIYVNIGACLGYPCWRGWRLRWCSCCCWGYKGNYDIFSVSAAMLLEAGAPLPLWVKGTVYGRYNILGGLVKGSCTFPFSSGKECRL